MGRRKARASVPSLVRTASAIALLATAAAGAGGGKLLSVRPVANPDATLVQLEADQPLSFTTLKLLGPPRVVVDLAETEVGGAAVEQEVEDGAVRRIAVAAAGAHTTRIVIELTADVDFDVRARGTKVEVRVPRPATATAIATATAAPFDAMSFAAKDPSCLITTRGSRAALTMKPIPSVPCTIAVEIPMPRRPSGPTSAQSRRPLRTRPIKEQQAGTHALFRLSHAREPIRLRPNAGRTKAPPTNAFAVRRVLAASNAPRW